MANGFANLNEFYRDDILKAVWDAFAELARRDEAANASTCFKLNSNRDGLFQTLFNRCIEDGLIERPLVNHLPDNFKHIVLKVFYSAINMGLILPHNANQALGWGVDMGVFQFTADGIKYFSNGYIPLDDPGYLAGSLQELQRRLPSITDGQIKLIMEAQRCLKLGCYRACMVVIGVANEDSCLALLEAVQNNCTPPAQGSANFSDWQNCTNDANNFARRWKPGIRILKEIKGIIRPHGRGQAWWSWWEMIPGSLSTLGEAIRFARNLAAHDTEREFYKTEVALLLSAMPLQMEMLANISSFLNNLPQVIPPIEL